MHRLTFFVQVSFWLFIIMGASAGVEYEWKQYDHIDRIYAMVFKGETAWFCSDVGIGKLNVTTRKTELVNYANSKCPINSANDIAIDRDGKIWVATDSGIAQFDGKQWNVFDTSNSILTSQKIWRVVVDSNNTIWFSSIPDQIPPYWPVQLRGGGLVRFNEKGWRIFDSTDLGFHTNRIDQMATGCNKLWLITAPGLCCRQSDSTWKYYDSTNSPISGNYLKRIQTDPQGTLWVLWSKNRVDNFLTALDTAGIWTTIDLKDSLPRGMLGDGLDFLTDHAGRLWFIKKNVGFVLWDRKIWEPYYYENCELPQRFDMETMAFDEKNRFWFTNYDTVSVFEFPKVTKFNLQGTIPIRNITAVVRDKVGDYWFSSYAGVLRLKGDTFTVFDTLNSGLISNTTTKIAIDPLNKKWIAHGCRPISIYNDTQWVTLDPTRPQDCVFDCLFDKKGTFWAFSYGIVASYANSTFHYDSMEYVSAFDVDASGKVWASSAKGAAVFDDTGWVFKGPNGLFFSDIHAAPDGKIWCSANYAVYCYNENTWKHFDTLEIGLPGTNRPLMVDSKGNVWENTSRGLMLYDGNAWSVVSRSSFGIPGLVKLLYEDNEGKLWFQTSGGLAVRNEKHAVNSPIPVHTNIQLKKSTTVQVFTGKPVKIVVNNTAFRKIKICTINGKVLRQFELNSPSGNFFLWDGKDEFNQYVSFGMYLITSSKR